MKATYGFRATMKARPGKGDELVALLTKEAHAANFTTDGAQALVTKLGQLVTEQALYQDEVLVGGKVNAGAVR